MSPRSLFIRNSCRSSVAVYYLSSLIVLGAVGSDGRGNNLGSVQDDRSPSAPATQNSPGDASPAMLGIVPVTESGRVVVRDLFVGGPAARAGLQWGDQIVAVDDIAVDSADQFIEMLAQYDAGTQIALQVNRNGWTNRLAVILGRRDVVSLLPRASQMANARRERRYSVILRQGTGYIDAERALNIYDPYLRALNTAFGQ